MHLKKIAIPRSWPFPKKGKKFIIKARGPHKTEISLPLAVVLRDMLKVVVTVNEAKKILHEGNILIDNRIIKDKKFSVGLFDRIYIKKLEKAFSLYLTKKGKLEIKEIDKEKLYKKPCKIIGKKILKNNKIQINLIDGKNFIINEKVKINDSVIINLKTKKIINFLRLAKGTHVLIIGGKYLGTDGEIISLDDKLNVKKGNEVFKISKENVYVVEKDEIKK